MPTKILARIVDLARLEPTYQWHEELEKAHAIQQHLLDRGDSRPVAHVDSSAVCRQAQAVGGDFYDLLRFAKR